MDYKASAQGVYNAVGGKANIVSAAQCATRLRLVVGDNKQCDIKAIEAIEGVKGVFEASGQLQIIFGTGTVNKVFDEFIRIAGIEAGSKEDVKKAAASRQNPFMRVIKALGDVFVPIIPAIVASGLMMGLLEGLTRIIPGLADSSWFALFNLMSNAAFVFLPIIIAVSAARVFGGNQFLGAVIGMIMIHPALINAWTVASLTADQIPSLFKIGSFSVNMVGYQGHVIPIVIAVWFMSVLEKKLHKIVPEMIDLFVTPLTTVFVTGLLAIAVIGPVFGQLETLVLKGATLLIALPAGLGGFLVGGFYAPTVVAGVHHMYNAIEAGLLSANGMNIWMPIATAANVAQGAAALAVAFKTKDRKIKALALPASLSAYLGITEPAIFGVNIRYKKPFVAGMIGGAIGGLFAAIMGIHASAYGVTGVFGSLIVLNGGTWNLIWYVVTILVASTAAFTASYAWYRDEETIPLNIVVSPLAGQTIPLTDVKDATFAQGLLGPGLAILPENRTGIKNKGLHTVTAPFDGRISTLFPTGHAIAVTNDDDVSVLIHVGLNTVELNGQYFEPLVKDGDRVKAGQPILRFNGDQILKAGYDITTPVVVVDADASTVITVLKNGSVKQNDRILSVKKALAGA